MPRIARISRYPSSWLSWPGRPGSMLPSSRPTNLGVHMCTSISGIIFFRKSGWGAIRRIFSAVSPLFCRRALFRWLCSILPVGCLSGRIPEWLCLRSRRHFGVVHQFECVAAHKRYAESDNIRNMTDRCRSRRHYRHIVGVHGCGRFPLSGDCFDFTASAPRHERYIGRSGRLCRRMNSSTCDDARASLSSTSFTDGLPTYVAS